MELKSTLKVFNEADLAPGPGIVKGQSFKRLIGNSERPSERVFIGLATFKPGTLEHLHWHMVEAFHYVISGRAIVRDIEGGSYEVSSGSVIYAPPGLAGSHEWEVKEDLVLLTARATTDPDRNLQFTVDPATMESRVDLAQLIGTSTSDTAGKFKKSLY
jgi:mannose-6-phosphate isomerase-like protein (cupin superfamily)